MQEAVIMTILNQQESSRNATLIVIQTSKEPKKSDPNGTKTSVEPNQRDVNGAYIFLELEQRDVIVQKRLRSILANDAAEKEMTNADE